VYLANSLYIFDLYRRELDIPNRPGIRGATEYALGRRRPDEPMIVLHPCIYFSVRCYAKGLAEPKLYSLPGRITHYTGRPILTEGDLISPRQLSATTSERIWVLDTTGYAPGTSRTLLPSEWKRQSDPVRFPDVYYFQGEVTVTEYRRRPGERADSESAVSASSGDGAVDGRRRAKVPPGIGRTNHGEHCVGGNRFVGDFGRSGRLGGGQIRLSQQAAG
jgi:hypothetical protein